MYMAKDMDSMPHLTAEDRKRLGITLCGMNLKTPVIGASGTYGFGTEYGDFIDLADVGAVVSKGLTPLPREGNPGVRIAETPSGMLNSIGLENPGVDHFLEHILPESRKLGTAFIANFSAGCVDEFAVMAEKLDVPGIDAVEVNISCPNVKDGGIVFGTDPHAAAAVTRAVREHTSKPVIMKLSPNVTDITEIARAVEDAGADAVSLINTLMGMVVDIERRRPLLGNVTGGLSGDAVRPVALRMVWQTAKAVKIPVIGMGGISSAEDAIAFMMAGAAAVEVGAENFRDPTAVVRIAAGMSKWMKAHGYESPADLIGILES